MAEIEISYNPKYKVSELPMVDSSNKAYTFLKDIFPSLNYREYFYILCLSRSNEAGQLLDITVLDHLILTSEACLSFADEGFM